MVKLYYVKVCLLFTATNDKNDGEDDNKNNSDDNRHFYSNIMTELKAYYIAGIRVK